MLVWNFGGSPNFYLKVFLILILLQLDIVTTCKGLKKIIITTYLLFR